MQAYTETIDSPAGPLTFAVDEAGALRWIMFDEGRYRRNDAEVLAREGFTLCVDRRRTALVARQLREYHAGLRRAFDLPLAPSGTPWQQAVWRALRTIPFGETRTYAQVAALIGQPGSARAVGSANAANQLPLVIPCHRIVGSDGSLTGFAGGLHLKARLLEHEARLAGLRQPAPA
jgi:methylated-DNA-[protein]-cysteine S-methyltransferase